jgi:hypothetical protein
MVCPALILPMETVARCHICHACAAFFCGMHVLPAASDISDSSTIRFFVAAAGFGYILPKLIRATGIGIAAAFTLQIETLYPKVVNTNYDAN